jgi:U4/U6.U5 tri-snRNP-associated protein 1
VKNKRELNSSLKGATLGDPDDKDDETLKWVKRSRKKEKELAKKRLEELSKMDETFVTDYSESIYFYTSYSFLVDSGISEDLAGLKVAHDMDQLVEGEEKILTLKDSRILDNEGKDSPSSNTSLMKMQRMNCKMLNWLNMRGSERTMS